MYFVIFPGNEKVSIIENPLTAADMATNVTHVLRFMAERKIKMHQINSKGKQFLLLYSISKLAFEKRSTVCLFAKYGFPPAPHKIYSIFKQLIQ